MKTAELSPWNETPAQSQRIVYAIQRLAAVMRAGIWQFATAEGLNPAQVEILELLSARDEPVRLSWLAQQLSVSAASASDSISSLTAKGLVEKSRALDDGRAVALRLTPSGSALAGRIGQALGFTVDAVASLSEVKQNALFESLLVLIGRLQMAQRLPELRACVSCRFLRLNLHPDAALPHHCLLLDAALPLSLLRLDCPDYMRADAATVAANWRQL